MSLTVPQLGQVTAVGWAPVAGAEAAVAVEAAAGTCIAGIAGSRLVVVVVVATVAVGRVRETPPATPGPAVAVAVAAVEERRDQSRATAASISTTSAISTAINQGKVLFEDAGFGPLDEVELPELDEPGFEVAPGVLELGAAGCPVTTGAGGMPLATGLGTFTVPTGVGAGVFACASWPAELDASVVTASLEAILV